MKSFFEYGSIILASVALGFVLCWALLVMPMQKSRDNARDFMLRLEGQASAARGTDLVYDNAALAHNMRVLIDVLDGRRDAAGAISE